MDQVAHFILLRLVNLVYTSSSITGPLLGVSVYLALQNDDHGSNVMFVRGALLTMYLGDGIFS